MRFVKTLGILLVIVAVFGAAAFALNFYTGPIIEANNAGAANDRLNAVMPGGAAYEDITATLTGVPASVAKLRQRTRMLATSARFVLFLFIFLTSLKSLEFYITW